MSDFNFKFHDGDPVPPDQIEIVNWQEKEMEPAINIFLCFIGALHQIVDNALKNSEASPVCTFHNFWIVAVAQLATKSKCNCNF